MANLKTARPRARRGAYAGARGVEAAEEKPPANSSPDARQSGAGFTLIELMIVVAIIGIMAAIAIPKFAELVRKSGEGSTRGQLGSIRSALGIYYGDMEGIFPGDLVSLTISGKYLAAMPRAKTPNYHADSAAVQEKGGNPTRDRGGWYYVDDAEDADFGSVSVQCTHTDTKGSAWSAY